MKFKYDTTLPTIIRKFDDQVAVTGYRLYIVESVSHTDDDEDESENDVEPIVTEPQVVPQNSRNIKDNVFSAMVTIEKCNQL